MAPFLMSFRGFYSLELLIVNIVIMTYREFAVCDPFLCVSPSPFYIDNVGIFAF